ncbi:15127_t:CDS:2, partial [Funneliformis mosseae]
AEDGNILFLVQDILNLRILFSLILTAIPILDDRYANSTDSEVTSIIPKEGFFLEYDQETEREPLDWTSLYSNRQYTIRAVKETIYFNFSCGTAYIFKTLNPLKFGLE